MNSTQQTFFSHGKLLLTGEYVVLDGATALAIPTKKGQELHIEPNTAPQLTWTSLDEQGHSWFSATFDLPQLSVQETDSTEVANTLSKILREAQQLNASFLDDTIGYRVTTSIDFPRDWGLGTSSTLINNIAEWAAVNVYTLLRKSFGGSGYDVAVARHARPIFYTLIQKEPSVKEVNLPWDFTDQLFFIHLNEKQDSKKAIAQYSNNIASRAQINKITDLTRKFMMCYTLKEFEAILDAHERIISEIINLPTVKARLFPDYKGAIKSLGAWGGDFILVSGTNDRMEYFRRKGFTTIIPFNEMLYT